MSGAGEDGPEPVPSPCTGRCTLDAADQCLGCRRHLAEIAAWGALTDDEKRAVLRQLPQRS